VTDEELQELMPQFSHAEKIAKIPDKYRSTYEICKKAPLSILPRYISYSELPPDKKQNDIFKNGYIENRLHNEFSCACDITEYRDIFQRLPLNENDVLRFIAHDSPPVSVLYFALGLETSEMLPGFFGNMLIKKEDIEAQLRKIKEVLKNLDRRAWDRARRFISVCTAGKPSQAYDDEIKNIFSALPTCLSEAKKRNKNFAAISTHQF
jgi:hypothetical protein